MERKDLSLGAFLNNIRNEFIKNFYNKSNNSVDSLMAGLAVFGLKFPSLLQFDKKSKTDENIIIENLVNLYGIERIPSDTSMRERIDEIPTIELGKILNYSFNILQRNKILENYVYLEDSYLLSIDGTEHFRSQEICCPHCCIANEEEKPKKKKSDENVEKKRPNYYHQSLVATIVHPDLKQVLPLDIEFITREDGDCKNDCELNAVRRLLLRIRKEHPRLKLIILCDSLYSNGPFVKLLEELGMKYIIRTKEGNNKALFNFIDKMPMDTEDTENPEDEKKFKYANCIPINDTHKDHKVNFLEYKEENKKNKITTFHWITNIKIKKSNLHQLMKGGRARWKIENETFNTLKNQGYNFEHNYGHGSQYLSNNMCILMLLHFLVDQVQEICSPLFRNALKKVGTYKELWQEFRTIIKWFVFVSWEHFLMSIVKAKFLDPPAA